MLSLHTSVDFERATGCSGLGVSLHPVRNRSLTKGLMPSTGEHPVLTVKRSLAWSITERPLTTVATVLNAVRE